MSKPCRYQVIVVGSGVAGMAAAELLSAHGLRVLVIDDNATAGGQLLRRPPHTSGNSRRFEPDRLKKWGQNLSDSISRGNVHLLQNAHELGIYPGYTL